MKIFPEPHNPCGLPPPEPGYRYLGEQEARKRGDQFRTTSGWRETSGPNLPAEQFTYRRALCVDDHLAPPPAEWSVPGFEVVLSSQLDPRVWEKPLFVWSPAPANRWITATSTLMSDWYYRRPICPPHANTSVPTPSMPTPKSIIINTHSSKPLVEAVLAVAKCAGWNWSGSSSVADAYYAIHPKGKELADVQRADILYWQKNKPEAIYLDAKTDMGKLIDLLDEMKKPVAPTPPKVNGYDGAYVKGTDVIKFGCAEISRPMLSRTRELMDIQFDGNRTVASVKLSSGVILDREQVRQILDYVDAVNQCA